MPLHIQYIYVGITNCFTLFYRELMKADFLSFRLKRSGVEKSHSKRGDLNADDADLGR